MPTLTCIFPTLTAYKPASAAAAVVVVVVVHWKI